MRSIIVSSALVLLTTFTSSTLALKGLGNSPCTAQCGNNLASTSGDDLVCNDSDYSASSSYGATGSVFQNCVSCQLSSTFVDPTTKQTDLQWGLYNLRWAVSWCLFGYPDNTNAGSTPCITSTACGPLQNMFEYDSLSPNATAYSYCALMNTIQVPKCNACLSQVQSQYYLTNFVTALAAGCQQQPAQGSTISVQGSVFSTTATNITSPSSSPTSTYNASAYNGLTLGAKIGIAVGCVLFLLGLTGFCIVWHGKRRRRNFLKKHQQETGYADWLAAQEATARNNIITPISPAPFFDSPQSQRPLVPGQPWGAGVRGVDEESPASAMGEKAYFSPYSSQYNSPVSAADNLPVVGQEWPTDRKGFGATTATSAAPGRSRSREKRGSNEVGDRIEMQNVAPVLLHPGHGRTGSLGLTEEDHRKGNAV